MVLTRTEVTPHVPASLQRTPKSNWVSLLCHIVLEDVLVMACSMGNVGLVQ